jgi:uncharacterized HAD superfamily protein
MSMVVIGIDLDGTLSESIENILSPSQLEKFRTLYNEFRIKEPQKIQGRIMGFAIRAFFDYKWRNWKKVKLLEEDIPDIVMELSKFAKIVIITSTSGKKEYIEKWLAYHNIFYDDIIFANPPDKWKYCDILIDDRMDVINEAVKHGCYGILLSKKEKKVRSSNFSVVNNWREVKDVLEEMGFLN